MANSPVPLADVADSVERPESHSPGNPEASTRRSKYSPIRKRKKTLSQPRRHKDSSSPSSSSASEGGISSTSDSSSSDLGDNFVLFDSDHSRLALEPRPSVVFMIC